VANRPEIKIYPVEYDPAPQWEHFMGHPTAQQNNSWRCGNQRSPDEDRHLRALVGKSVRVHTSNAGQIQGVLEAVLFEAIILRTERRQVLIYNWAIDTIESE
jgi:sRNA-binding regulator protein Hfq